MQDIKAIKEELERLEIDMNKHFGTDKCNRYAVRYWAIRWVMGWEKEIPS